MGNKKGLTLIEIIIAMALLGVIAVSIIPAFTSQLVIMNKGQGLTKSAFEAQADVERLIFDVRQKLQQDTPVDAVPGIRVTTVNLFGSDTDIYRMRHTSPGGKSLYVFLSGELAKVEKQSLLVARNVRIVVSSDPSGKVADIGNFANTTLTALCNPNNSPTFFRHLYKWYVSREGIADPQFPEDYTQLTFIGEDPNVLSNLMTRVGVNRFVICSITPVDVNGLRGEETQSDPVYVMGIEWRAGSYAWIDKNNNGNDDSTADNTGEDRQIKADKYLTGFDSSVEYTADEHAINPSNGAFYIPMNAGGHGGSLEVNGTDKLEWTIDRDIHLAKGFDVLNNTDIAMSTREGSITLYQDIFLNGAGEAQLINGIVRTVDSGPLLKTGRDITLTADGGGLIGINNYAGFEGRNVNITASGQFYMIQGTLKSKGNMVIDTTFRPGVPGNRDIYIDDSAITMTGTGSDVQTITLKSRNALVMNTSTINGNGAGTTMLSVSANTGAAFRDVLLTKIHAELKSDARMESGGWDLASTLKVADGKTITFSNDGGKVANDGALDLGNTGAVKFDTSMKVDLKNPLTLTMSNGPIPGQVILSGNYGRNVAYAEPKGPESVTTAGVYQDLGSGQTNLSYTANKTAAHVSGLGSLTYSFDGTNAIDVAATASGPVSDTIRLYVKDKYSGGEIASAVDISLNAAAAGPVTVTVQGAVGTIRVTGINVSSDSDTLYKGAMMQMRAEVTPADASNKSVVWSVVSGETYASIDRSTGWLTSLANGTVKVRATASDGYGAYGEKTITVNQIAALGQVRNVHLSNKGIASWTAVSGALGYRLQLYKQNADEYDPVGSPVITEARTYSLLNTMKAAGPGTYYIKVSAKGDGKTVGDGPASDPSETQTLTQLKRVSEGLEWSGQSARWNAVTNPAPVNYAVQLYKYEEVIGTPVLDTSSPYNFSDLIYAYGPGYYRYTVQAKAAVDSLVIDSPVTDISNGLWIFARQWGFYSTTEGWTRNGDVYSLYNSSYNGVWYIRGEIDGGDPYIVSADRLGVNISGARYIEIVMNNQSDSTLGQIYFTTNEKTGFDETKLIDFATIKDDDYTTFRTYLIDMKTVTDWDGTLKQLRIDPATGVNDGYFRIDSISIY